MERIGQLFVRITVRLDLALAAIPISVLMAIGALVVIWLSLLTFLSLPLLTLGVLAWTAFSLWRARADGDDIETTLRSRQPRIRREYQRRLAIIRRLVVELCTSSGTPVPNLLIAADGSWVNMSFYRRRSTSIITVTEALLDPERSPSIDEAGLRGIVAHELAHARPVRIDFHKWFDGLRLFTGRLMLISLVAWFASDTPLTPLAAALASAPILGLLRLITTRREEIEADLVAALLLGPGGEKLVMLGLMEAGVAAGLINAGLKRSARAINSLSLSLALARRMGVIAPDSSFSLRLEHSLKPAGPGLGARVARAARRLSMPFGDHPNLEAMASLLGVSSIDHIIATDYEPSLGLTGGFRAKRLLYNRQPLAAA